MVAPHYPPPLLRISRSLVNIVGRFLEDRGIAFRAAGANSAPNRSILILLRLIKQDQNQVPDGISRDRVGSIPFTTLHVTKHYAATFRS